MAVPSYISQCKDKQNQLTDLSTLNILEKEDAKIIFEEKLKLVDGDGNVVDEVTISVEPEVGDRDGFVILHYSQDESLLLRAKSHVTRALQTMDEVRKVKLSDTEKLLRITNKPDLYRLFLVETDLEQRTGLRVKTELKKTECEPFVLEGANVLFLRKLALSRLFGEITVFTVDNSGVLCEAQYKVEDMTTEIRVTRVVGSETMTTVLNLCGRILYHQWSTSQSRLESELHRSTKVSKKAVVGEGEQEGGESEAESQPMVDLPAYWEKKEEVTALLKEYMVINSSVQEMITDLIKNILFEKPDDPIEFADEFFSEFLGIPREFEPDVQVEMKPEVEQLETNPSDPSITTDI